MSPQARVRAAWLLFAICLIAWPATSLSVWKHEPQGVLALSWVSIIIGALQMIITTDVRKQQED